MKYNLDNLIGKIVNGYVYLYSNSDSSVVTGNMSLWTNEYQSTRVLRIQGTTSNWLDGITGTLNNFVLHNSTVSIIINLTGITGGFSAWNKNCGTLNLSDNRFFTAAIDSQLAVINAYFTTNTPIKNLTINLSGGTMGIPTGGIHNVDLLGIIAKHAAAGFTATITVRTL